MKTLAQAPPNTTAARRPLEIRDSMQLNKLHKLAHALPPMRTRGWRKTASYSSRNQECRDVCYQTNQLDTGHPAWKVFFDLQGKNSLTQPLRPLALASLWPRYAGVVSYSYLRCCTRQGLRGRRGYPHFTTDCRPQYHDRLTTALETRRKHNVGENEQRSPVCKHIEKRTNEKA